MVTVLGISLTTTVSMSIYTVFILNNFFLMGGGCLCICRATVLSIVPLLEAGFSTAIQYLWMSTKSLITAQRKHTKSLVVPCKKAENKCLTHQSRSVDHREVVAIKERWAQGAKEGGTQQAGCKWLLTREHTWTHYASHAVLSTLVLINAKVKGIQPWVSCVTLGINAKKTAS